MRVTEFCQVLALMLEGQPPLLCEFLKQHDLLLLLLNDSVFDIRQLLNLLVHKVLTKQCVKGRKGLRDPLTGLAFALLRS